MCHTFPTCFGVSHTVFRENLAHSLSETTCFYKPIVFGTLVASKHIEYTPLLVYNIFTMVTVIYVACYSVCCSVPSGPCSIVGIATGYGMDGPGIESRWGRDFSHLSSPALGPTQPPVQCVPGLSPGIKRGRGVTLTPHPLLVQLVMKD